MADGIEEVRKLASQSDGWLSDSEGELLYKLAKDVPSGQAIVEIGGWHGKATVWLAKGTEAGQQNKVYSIDPRADTDSAFLSNLAKVGVQATVIPLATTWDEAAKRWREKVGLLWMDAFQDYEDVTQAFLSWQRYLLPGAMVAVSHCDQPGPARFVEEHIKHSTDFAVVQSVDRIVVMEKNKCRHYWSVDSTDIGVCKYCGKKTDFKKLTRDSNKWLGQSLPLK